MHCPVHAVKHIKGILIEFDVTNLYGLDVLLFKVIEKKIVFF